MAKQTNQKLNYTSGTPHYYKFNQNCSINYMSLSANKKTKNFE